ncbi:hypothetical protein GF366_02220 [Candidatus Peregrinibacteria bacterium]|nr:hypothetical protein [Candidatus Peregrinibacteria bacterium]
MAERKKYPILIAIPHASTFVPKELKDLMLFNDFQIRKQSDLYTGEIFDVPNAYVVKAKISRLVVDVNRAPDDIEMEYKLYHEGVVVSVDEFGEQIYKTPPDLENIFGRVEKYHEPFHKEIDELSKKAKFLIDAHSLWNIGPKMRSDTGMERADIVLGNRDYTTCSRDTTLKIYNFFKDKGFSVKINEPYSGKYILGYHCSRRGLPGMQIEINRKLYMNEKTLRPKKREIKKLRKIIIELTKVINEEIGKYENMGNRSF